MARLIDAIKIFFRLLKDRDFSDKMEKIEKGLMFEPSVILGLFQKNARFIDFILEDVGSYSDAEIGAVARSVHLGCGKILKENITIEPLMKDSEGSNVTVEEGFDPSAIKLVGNVTGKPPFKGILAHHGWKVKEVKIPAIPKGHDPSVIVPAEVEL